MKTVFLRALEADDKAAVLLHAIREPETASEKQRFEVEPTSFASVPRSPFVYWVSERLRRRFKELPPFEAEGRTAKQGLATADDFRFVRAWWEVPPQHARWFPFTKGGKSSPFYTDIPLVVHWERDGELMKAWAGSLYNDSHWSRILEFFFRPGLTWPARPYQRGSFSLVPPGAVFSHTGTMVFCDREADIPVLGAICNSDPFIGLLHLLMPRGGRGSDRTLKYEVGYVMSVPIPQWSDADADCLGQRFYRGWSLKRSLDTCRAISHAFTLPALLQVGANTLAERTAAWVESMRAVEVELGKIRAEIDERCFDLYGIDEADRKTITEGFGHSGDDAESNAEVDSGDAEDESDDAADATSLAAELVSWFVGVAFGRFDIRLATAARALPVEPEPFDPLPVCPPGILQNAQDLPTRPEDVPATYSIQIPWEGILVDDPNHPLDIEGRVREVIDIIWKDRAEAIEREAGEILGVTSLREYFRKPSGFFADHLKRYSKSRRQAPIYWPLSTASGSYTIWIYCHRLNDDLLYKAVNSYLNPKITDIERRVQQIEADLALASGSQATKLRVAFEETRRFRNELLDFKEELLRVTGLPYKPNLNDGVLITAAPLWKLFRLPKWRKDLETCWKKLEAGEYDWTHLAYAIWPDRVREVCKRDRSIAIAHGLEDICEVPPPRAGKKTRGRGRREAIQEEMDLDVVDSVEDADA